MNKFFRNISFYLLIFILVLSLIQWYSTKDINTIKIDYTQLIKAVNEGQIPEMVIVGKNISGVMKNGQNFTSYIPDVGLFLERIDDKIESGAIKVDIQPPPEPPWWAQISLQFFWFYSCWCMVLFMQQSQGRRKAVMSFGKARQGFILKKGKGLHLMM